MEIQKWPDGLPRSGNQQFETLKPVNNWFEIFRINKTTFAFLEPHHDEEVFSYLLLGSRKAALIDTGMGVANILAEVENITSLPVVVLNTHTHFDHTGDNFRFKEIACFDHAYELENLNSGHSNQFCKGFMQPGSYRNLPPGFIPDKYKIKPSKATIKLQHLDQMDLGDRVLTIHHTPGHSPGSICIEDSKYNILFTGDTYYRGTVFFHLPGSSYHDCIETADYLHSLVEGIEVLCPGHNECCSPKSDIISFQQAMAEIENEQAGFKTDNDSRFYQFDHFNLRLPLS